MKSQQLLQRLLRIVGDSDDYFISGSLSFLPLLPPYREPGGDIDASLSAELFHKRRDVIVNEGCVHVLRFDEVAVAQDSPLARFLAPRTAFVHVHTADGLLDLTAYSLTRTSLVFHLGLGITFEVPRCVLDRVAVLTWLGCQYRAGPPELAFLPKAVWYIRSCAADKSQGGIMEKHLGDLAHMFPLMDWEFIERLLRHGSVRWFGRRLPRFIDVRLNPFRALDSEELRQRLQNMAQQDCPANGSQPIRAETYTTSSAAGSRR